MMIETLTLVVAVIALLVIIWLAWRTVSKPEASLLGTQLEEKHRAMLLDLNDGLNKLGDRLNAVLADSSERLKQGVALELNQTRDAMQALQAAQTDNLAKNREALLEKLGSTFETLNKVVEGRLDLISGKVSERLDEGFKKTNETFTNVMARLATIDEAQKKIDGLTTNVVSLHDLLSNKSSRGAFGEVQLEGLVRNVMPPNAYQMQYTLSNNSRVDCALFLPEPMGTLAIDSKFPLENYHRMYAPNVAEGDRLAAQRAFKADVKKHVNDIAAKYIIPNQTADGALMFIPAEAVYAEIYAYHADVAEYAAKNHVWIASPTTLMAILNTVCAVLKDVETRKQVHIIQEALGKLGKEFGRFDTRMKKLADHIRLAHEDAENVQISSRKITQRFAQIERVDRVELENGEPALLELPDDEPEQ